MAERLSASATPVIDEASLRHADDSTVEKPIIVISSNGNEYKVRFSSMSDKNPDVINRQKCKDSYLPLRNSYFLSLITTPKHKRLRMS